MGVWEDVDRLGILIRRSLAAVYTADGLRRYEFEVLTALRSTEPTFSRTPTELARALLVSPAAITDRIDRLVERGWVERHPTPADARSVQIALTPEGEVVADEARQALEKAQRSLLATLTPTDQHTLDKLLRQLLAALEE